MAFVDRSRVRTRVANLVPRITPVGHAFMFEGGSWQRPPLANEADYYYQAEPWYDRAETTADEIHLGPPYVTGGPFTSIKLFTGLGQLQAVNRYGLDKSAIQFFTGVGPRPVMYQGGFHPVWPNDSDLPVAYRNMWDTDRLLKINSTTVPDVATAWGPVAWAKSAPKIEMASGFVALAESRDLPRMLKQTSKGFHDIWKAMGGNIFSAKQAPKKVSDHFLNHQFGWYPFLSDMSKFYTAYSNHDQYMGQMARDNGKWRVRRRTLLDDFQETKLLSGTTWRVSPGTQAIQSQMTTGPMSWEIWEEKLSLITSVGKFKWYKPEFDVNNPEVDSAYNRIMRESALYGVRVSPSNIWRATPWTWLIDWGLNVGRNIDRITEVLQDGVVSQYLYLMQRQVSRLSLRVTIPFKQGVVSMQFFRSIESKQRREAGSPYGFGLSWDQLTPKRLAILAALGISRNG